MPYSISTSGDRLALAHWSTVATEDTVAAT